MILCVVQICQPLKFAEWKEKCRKICQEELVHCLHTHLRSAFVYQIACFFFHVYDIDSANEGACVYLVVLFVESSKSGAICVTLVQRKPIYIDIYISLF